MDVGSSAEPSGEKPWDSFASAGPDEGDGRLQPDILDSGEAGGAVIRGGMQRVAAFVAGVAIGLVSAPLMVRHLGVADFGKFVTVTSLVLIVGGLTEAGLTAVGVREYGERPVPERIAFLRSLQGLRAILTLAGVALAVLFGIAADYEPVMILGIAIAGIGLVLTNALLTFQIPLLSGLRLGWAAALDLIRQTATFAAILVLVLVGSDLLPFFAVSTLAAILAISAAIPLVRGGRSLLPRVAVREWTLLLRETVHFAVAMALGVVYYRVVILIMSVFSSETETGVYSIAFRVVEVAVGIPWLLVNSAFPVLARAARDDQQRLRHALQRLFEVAVIAGAWLALVTVVGAPLIIEVVAGENIGDSVVVLQLLGGSLAATFLVAHWGLSLLTLRAYRALLAANAGALLVGLALAAVLVPWGDALGGALASLITEAALAAAYGVILVRLRPDLRPNLKVVAPVALAVTIGAAPAVVTEWPAAVLIGTATAGFLGTVALTKALPPEIVALLARRGKRLPEEDS